MHRANFESVVPKLAHAGKEHPQKKFIVERFFHRNYRRATMWDHPANFLFLLFPVFFVLMWGLVLNLISLFGGWRSLAAKYEASGPPKGTGFGMQSMKLGNFTNYGNCVTMHVSVDGLDLRPMVLFKFGHKPLLIPWRELHDPRPRRIFWYRMVSLRVGSPNGKRLTIPEKVFLEGKSLL